MDPLNPKAMVNTSHLEDSSPLEKKETTQMEKTASKTASSVKVRTTYSGLKSKKTESAMSAKSKPPLPESLTKQLKEMVRTGAVKAEEEEPILSKLQELHHPNFFIRSGTKVDDDKTILWRGCRPDQLIAMVRTGTAGGKPSDINTPAPTDKEACAQVGEQSSLPEFSSDEAIALSFGTGTFMIAIVINKSYLTKGSGSEKGEVANESAPLQIIGFKDGRKLDVQPQQNANRSLTNQVTKYPY